MKSARSEKQRFGHGLARYRTSSFSISPRTESGVSSIIGTTTRVRQSSGMPSSNDIFGSTRGGMNQSEPHLQQVSRKFAGGNQRKCSQEQEQSPGDITSALYAANKEASRDCQW